MAYYAYVKVPVVKNLVWQELERTRIVLPAGQPQCYPVQIVKIDIQLLMPLACNGTVQRLEGEGRYPGNVMYGILNYPY